MPIKLRARTAKADKKINEKFRKRKRSLMNKADQLARLCQADVYLVVFRENQHFTYSSTDKAGWPTSTSELSSNWPLTQRLTPQDFEDGKDKDEIESPISDIEEETTQAVDTQQEERRKVITLALPPVFCDTPVRPHFDLSRPFH